MAFVYAEGSYTLYTLTSVSILSILFSIHFLGQQGDFVKQPRASLVDDHNLICDSVELDASHLHVYCDFICRGQT